MRAFDAPDLMLAEPGRFAGTMPISSRSAPSTSSAARTAIWQSRVKYRAAGRADRCMAPSPRHAGRGPPGQVFTSPTRRDGRGGRSGGNRQRLPFHRQELRGGHDELPDGRRSGRCYGRDRRRRGRRKVDLVDRSPGCCGYVDRREVVGAAAEQGVSLAQLKALGDDVNFAAPNRASRSRHAPCRPPGSRRLPLGKTK